MGNGKINTYRALASSSRVEILHVLQSQGELPLRDVASAVELHSNTVREHLDRLVEAGFVESRPEHRGTRGRPRLLYRASDAPGHRSLDANFRAHFMKVLVAGYGTAMDSPATAAQREGARWATGALESRARDEGADDAPDAAPPETPSTPGPVEPSAPGGAGARGPEELPEAGPDPRAGLRQLAALDVHLEELGLEPEVDVADLKVHLRRCPFIELARARTEVVCSVHLGVARGILEHEGGPVVAERLEPLVGPRHCILHLALPEADAPAG